MPFEAETYLEYTRQCADTAARAETPELRDKLPELARAWLEASWREDKQCRVRLSMEPTMATIIPFLRSGENVFDPKDITAMSMALDDVCKALNLRDDSSAREVMAVRIIDLARTGERSPTRLRDRVLHEVGMAERIGLDGDVPTGKIFGGPNP